MTNEMEMAGPVMPPAVDAVMVKMPAPITTDTPKTVRSHQFRSLCNRVDGSSVSAIDCSTDLVRQAIGRPSWSCDRNLTDTQRADEGKALTSTVGVNGAEWEARCRHRGQHR